MNTLDCKGLMCPMPTVELTKKIRKMKVGDELEMISDDAHSKEDIPAWCYRTGNQLIGIREVEGEFIFHIKKQR
jgi:tRNA 2-thiouridine synthesizing protein A